jgi:C-terminal processing protease CtpA/Prc
MLIRPYCIYSRVDVKVSKQFLKVQQLGMLGPFAGLLQGHVVTWHFKSKPLQAPAAPYKFDGSVYVLVGPGTFSTASDFAHVIEDLHLGTLVGEETGGLRQCFGDCPTFRLPHSNMSFSVSTKRFYAPIPKPGDATHGCLPDIPITDAQLAPFADAKDPAVAFVLDLIERQSARE